MIGSKPKYDTNEKLQAAWGDAIKANESLESKNFYLEMNPWFLSSDNISGASKRVRCSDEIASAAARRDGAAFSSARHAERVLLTTRRRRRL